MRQTHLLISPLPERYDMRYCAVLMVGQCGLSVKR